MTVRSDEAALHLCRRSDWTLSNLQIQKIIYMADMNYVGQYGKRLVGEDFQAWDYGPVLPSLYHKFKAFGAKAVPNVFWGVPDISGTKEGDMLDLAWENLREMTPGQLVETTHSGLGAWVRRYVPGAKQIKILTQDMVDEYARRTQQTSS